MEYIKIQILNTNPFIHGNLAHDKDDVRNRGREISLPPRLLKATESITPMYNKQKLNILRKRNFFWSPTED